MQFAPLFTGKLVRLAPKEADDQDAFARWTQDEDYLRLLDDDPIRPLSPASFAHFGDATNSDDPYFHLRTLAEDKVIGFVVLFNIKWRNQSAELAIGIGEKAYRGRGYGQDALRLILNYAFVELCLHRVSLTVISYNTSAIKAYERVGFQREGVLRHAIQRDNQRYDMLVYGILRDDWNALPRE